MVGSLKHGGLSLSSRAFSFCIPLIAYFSSPPSSPQVVREPVRLQTAPVVSSNVSSTCAFEVLLVDDDVIVLVLGYSGQELSVYGKEEAGQSTRTG